MKKQVVSVLMVAMMIAAMVGGCGKKTEPAAAETEVTTESAETEAKVTEDVEAPEQQVVDDTDVFNGVYPEPSANGYKLGDNIEKEGTYTYVITENNMGFDLVDMTFGKASIQIQLPQDMNAFLDYDEDASSIVLSNEDSSRTFHYFVEDIKNIGEDKKVYDAKTREDCITDGVDLTENGIFEKDVMDNGNIIFFMEISRDGQHGFVTMYRNYETSQVSTYAFLTADDIYIEDVSRKVMNSITTGEGMNFEVPAPMTEEEIAEMEKQNKALEESISENDAEATDVDAETDTEEVKEPIDKTTVIEEDTSEKKDTKDVKESETSAPESKDATAAESKKAK